MKKSLLVLVLASSLAVSVAACGSAAVAPEPIAAAEPAAASTPAGLTLSEWTSGPYMTFFDSMDALGSSWIRSGGGCTIAERNLEQARSADAPPNTDVATPWNAALDGLDDMIAACWGSDWTAMSPAADRYFTNMLAVETALASANGASN